MHIIHIALPYKLSVSFLSFFFILHSYLNCTCLCAKKYYIYIYISISSHQYRESHCGTVLSPQWNFLYWYDGIFILNQERGEGWITFQIDAQILRSLFISYIFHYSMASSDARSVLNHTQGSTTIQTKQCPVDTLFDHFVSMKYIILEEN